MALVVMTLVLIINWPPTTQLKTLLANYARCMLVEISYGDNDITTTSVVNTANGTNLLRLVQVGFHTKPVKPII